MLPRDALLAPYFSKAAEFLHAASSAAEFVGRDVRGWFVEPETNIRHTALIVNGHPDPRPDRFCAAITRACAEGARSAGCVTEQLTVAGLPTLNNQCVQPVDERIRHVFCEADRLTIVFPLWLNYPPKLLVHFLEDLQRQTEKCKDIYPAPRSCKTRLIVTMELPAFPLREAMKRNPTAEFLSLPGVAAREVVLVGGVSSISAERRRAWLDVAHEMGAERL